MPALPSFLRGALALSLALLTATATAQAAYPNKPIRIVVPFGSATSTDAMARVYARRLAEQMGVAVVVENREGAGGLIGATAAANAAADGYTVLLAVHPPFAIGPLLQKEKAYDPVKDFTPIARVARVPLALVAHKSVPFKTFQEMVAYAKANPGKLDYASAGIGVPSHIFMEQIKQELGIDITFVPYKSTGQMTTDLLAGQVPMTLQTFGVAKPGLASGQLIGLAIGSSRRNPAAPDMPTLNEVSGKPALGANVSIWYGFLAPRNLPPAIVAKLHAEIAAATQSADMATTFQTLSADSALAGPADFARDIAVEAEQSRKLVQSLRLGPN